MTFGPTTPNDGVEMKTFIFIIFLLIIRKIFKGGVVGRTATLLLKISLAIIVASWGFFLLYAVVTFIASDLKRSDQIIIVEEPEEQKHSTDILNINSSNPFLVTAQKYEIDPVLLIAIAHTETGGKFNNDAKGAAGEVSLMQLMPQIIKWCSLSSTPTQEQAIDCAGNLIKNDIIPNVFNPTRENIFASYNAGWPSINKCKCIPNTKYVELANVWYNYYSDFGNSKELGRLTNDWHGSVTGWFGYDYSVGCGNPIYSPLTGVVVTNGLDGWVGPLSKGKQNTLLVIKSLSVDLKVALLHGNYTVQPGTFVIRSLTPVGTEASIGNSTGCHTHYVKWVNGINIR